MQPDRFLLSTRHQPDLHITFCPIECVLISASTILPLSSLITEITNNVEESATPTVGRRFLCGVNCCNRRAAGACGSFRNYLHHRSASQPWFRACGEGNSKEARKCRNRNRTLLLYSSVSSAVFRAFVIFGRIVASNVRRPRIEVSRYMQHS